MVALEAERAAVVLEGLGELDRIGAFEEAAAADGRLTAGGGVVSPDGHQKAAATRLELLRPRRGVTLSGTISRYPGVPVSHRQGYHEPLGARGRARPRNSSASSGLGSRHSHGDARSRTGRTAAISSWAIVRITAARGEDVTTVGRRAGLRRVVGFALLAACRVKEGSAPRAGATGAGGDRVLMREDAVCTLAAGALVCHGEGAPRATTDEPNDLTGLFGTCAVDGRRDVRCIDSAPVHDFDPMAPHTGAPTPDTSLEIVDPTRDMPRGVDIGAFVDAKITKVESATPDEPILNRKELTIYNPKTAVTAALKLKGGGAGPLRARRLADRPQPYMPPRLLGLSIREEPRVG